MSRNVLPIAWEALLEMPEWAAQVAAPVRRVAARVEVIDPRGQSLGDAAIDAGTVAMSGGGTEMWEASLSGTDPEWLPVDQTDPLDTRSGNRLRVWWQEWIPALGGWGEIPLMTGWPHNPVVTDERTVGWSVTVRDALQEAKRGGYGGQTVECGGMTVDKALAALFDTVAPLLDYDFPETDAAVPVTFTLGENDPDKDWVDIAAVAGWGVWADREGVITAGPVLSTQTVDWSEGPGCRVTSLRRQVTTTELKNKVIVRSTNSDVVPALVAIAQDVDPSSPTYVGTHGPWVVEVDSDAVATQEDADVLARTLLAKALIPATEVTGRVTLRPDLGYGDVIELERDRIGLAGPHQVMSWRMTLPKPGTPPELMEVSLSPGLTIGQEDQ